MLRILRRSALFFALVLALSAASALQGVGTALADDCCCECTCCCDCCCCCEDGGGVLKCSARHNGPDDPWGCETNLTACPDGTSPIDVTCLYYGQLPFTTSGPITPPLDPFHAAQLAAVDTDADAAGQWVYVRYMVCNNATYVASYHLVPAGPVPPNKPDMVLQECGAPDIQDPLTMIPIEPDCGAPPYRYVH